MLLSGKTALVIGVANRWSIAYAIASAFVREGAKLVLTYQSERQKGMVEELGAELKADKVLACDVTKPDELDNLIARAEQGRRHSRCLRPQHRVREQRRSQPPVSSKPAAMVICWRRRSAPIRLWRVSRAVAPLMTNGGSIMTLTYLGATRVITNYNVMGVAKAALEASMRYLASELGPQKIRVNAISAGPIKTASARAVKDLSKMLEAFAEHSPLRRNTDPGGGGRHGRVSWFRSGPRRNWKHRFC